VSGAPSLERMSLNQRTIRQWSLPQAIDGCVRAGVPAIGVWREPLADTGLSAGVRLLRRSGLRVSSLCRAGFFTDDDQAGRTRAKAANRRAVDEAAAIGAACLVLVVGGLPEGSRDLDGARVRVADGLADLAPYAVENGVRLAVEPMHPAFAADRSVVTNIGEAVDLAAAAGSAAVVGVVVDAYHVWWDPHLATDLARSAGRIASYQVSDWVTPIPADILNGRGLMGDGHIDLPWLGAAVERAGYRGDVEVEIFNSRLWAEDPAGILEKVKERYLANLSARPGGDVRP
jgi:sugar phosphate isomerase/epimerase